MKKPMLITLIVATCFMSFMAVQLQAQTRNGAIRGTIYESNSESTSKEKYASSKIEVIRDGRVYATVYTDVNGEYFVKGLPAGHYDVRWLDCTIHDITVRNIIEIVDFELIDGKMVDINYQWAFNPPLLYPRGSSALRISGKQLTCMPGRSF